MIRNRDFIVVGLQPWDIEIGSNCKNIALELARNNRVLYVNSPLDRNTLLRRKNIPAVRKRLKIRKNGDNLVKIQENLWNYYPPTIINSINWMPFIRLFKFFNRINNKKFAGDIKQALKQLGFKDFILFNDSDIFRSYYLPELLEPALSIYYSRDNLMVYKYWHKHGHILEPELMKKSSLVLSNSAYLAKIAEKHNPHSFNIGQGCDLTVFDPARGKVIPEDMRNIKRPVIGYIGAILSLRLDLDLLVNLCGKRPDWSFVFVGNMDSAFRDSQLPNLPNVHFLGLKDEKVLPEYLASFDVAFNPQCVNDYTIGNYPRKIDEYLALGKPVVATYTVTMELFKDYVYLGRTMDDYVNLIEIALAEGNDKALQDRRIRFAHTHTWENSVKAIADAIEKVKLRQSSAITAG